MPLLSILVTSTDENVTIPTGFVCSHLHLKMVSVKLSAASAADNSGMEIQLPFLRHYYQINGTSNRANLVVPLSSDVKTTLVYPDVVFVGENVPQSFNVKLLDASDGSAWTDSGGATVQSCLIMFEYAVKDE